MTGIEFCQAASQSNTDDCILWPLRRNRYGYGQIKIHGKKTTVHRYVCILAHGDRSNDFPLVAHSCRNRHCVNPRHLRWATWQENMDDRTKDGTVPCGEVHHFTILTEEHVLQIREAKAVGKTIYALEKEYGIRATSIAKICRGESWRHVGGPRTARVKRTKKT